MTALQNVSLASIGGGALAELFEAELAKVLGNIADPNTDPETKRAITVTVAFKPKKDREVVDVQLKCASKLAGVVTFSTQVFVGKHQGKLIAVESDPRQSNLFDKDAPKLAPVASITGRS